MSITNEMNRLIAAASFDWAYCVITHIAGHGAQYEEVIKSYDAVCGLFGNPQKNMEPLTSGYAPLPNGGQALFAICYRDVPVTGLLSQIQNQVNQSNPPQDNILLVFVPTTNVANTGDTAISVYKIENGTVSKL
jgi:hypothetical protein